MTIGQRIAAERAAKGLTQSALAHAAGIAQPTLSVLERDGKGVTWATLQAIAEALGLPAWKLIRPL